MAEYAHAAPQFTRSHTFKSTGNVSSTITSYLRRRFPQIESKKIPAHTHTQAGAENKNVFANAGEALCTSGSDSDQ